jgi:hypothetical protein
MANEFIARKGLIVLTNGAKITGSLEVNGAISSSAGFSGDGSGLTGLTGVATFLGLSGSTGNDEVNLITETLSVLGSNGITTTVTDNVVTINLPVGTVSASSQVDHDTTTNFVANEHIDHSTVSMSAGLGLNGGGDLTISRTLTLDTGSVHFVSGAIENVLNPKGVFSSSAQVSYTGLSSIPSGIVSSSTQVSYTGLSNIPSGIVSSSTQIPALLPDGTVSASSQVSYTQLSNIPSGIVSSSSQLPSGIVSSSTQIPALLPDGTVSSSAQLPSGIVSSSTQIPALLPNGTVSASSQVQLASITGTTFGAATYTFPQDLVVSGRLTAQEFYTELVSSSIVFESGSTKFGDTADDTHSFTGTLQVTGSAIIQNVLYTSGTNSDVDSGTEVIAEVSTATYDAAFFDYVVKKENNYRAGTVMAVWDGTNIEFTDTSTNDLGNTAEVLFSVDISSGQARLKATVSTNDWSIKTAVRAL